MKKIFLLILSFSLIALGTESPKKWFHIKPYSTETTLQNDTNVSNSQPAQTHLMHNLKVFKNLLDRVDKDNTLPADPKNWFSMDDE